MTTIERTVSTSEFQQECLNMMHKVSATGIPIVITENHKPMVKLTRIDDASQLYEKRSLDSLKGTVSILGDIVNFSTEDEWDVLKIKDSHTNKLSKPAKR
jgi:hypothetical protein